MTSKVLIRGGCVLTLGATTPNYPEADVLIDGDRIAEIGPSVRARNAEQVDATNTIVMPGFVDTHRHAWESLFRNFAPLDPSFADIPPQYSPDDLYAATLLSLLGASAAGITTVVDWCAVANSTDHAEAALQAHVDSGIRSVFALGASDQDPSAWQVGLRTIARADTGALTTTAAGPLSPRHHDLDGASADWAVARELGFRVHAHAATTPDDRGVTAALAQRDLLGADVTLVHCLHLDRADVESLASSGAGVSLTPAADMMTGLGMPSIQALVDSGIRPGLGVGSERTALGDMFAQMRAVISVQHATVFERKLAGKGGLPKLLTTREVLRYATESGAAAIGLAEVGSIEPGMQADLVLLRTDRPNIYPVNDPIGAVVWGMDTSNVDWVFVGGRALMRNGVLEADVAGVRELAATAQRRLAAASGLETGIISGAVG